MKHIVFVLGVAALLFSSCREDKRVDARPTETSFSALTMGEDVALRLRYDMITATFVLPEDPADTADLTIEEKALATPVYRGKCVNQIVYKNGTVDADMEKGLEESLPDYPVNAIGGKRAFPMAEEDQLHRIEVRGGTVTCYNTEGEILGSGLSNTGNIAYLQTAVQHLGEGGVLEGEQFEYVLESLRQAGFDIVDNEQHSNLAKWTYQRADGGQRILYIDKALQKITTRINVSATGETETVSQYLFEETDSGVVPVVHRFVTYFDSPFSETRMTIRKVSKFKNFEIEKNL
jgi:hypothetical protein